MNSKLMCVLAFSLGAAVGSAVSWRYLKAKYEQLSREEIADVKDKYAELYGTRRTQEKPVAPNSEEVASMQEHAKKIAENAGYTDYTKINEEGTDTTAPEDAPYVISPEEFREFDDYEAVTLMYYADGVLTEDDDIVEDIVHTIGEESLKTFGQYEDDCVHVRNDRLKCDYEILRDTRNYADIRKSTNPSRVED